MEDGEGESDVAEVAGAELQRLHASGAFADLARRALERDVVSRTLTGKIECNEEAQKYKRPEQTYQARIKRSMLVWRAVVLDVVEHLVRDLEDGLVDDVLVGPVGVSWTL